MGKLGHAGCRPNENPFQFAPGGTALSSDVAKLEPTVTERVMDVPVFASGFYEQFGYDRPRLHAVARPLADRADGRLSSPGSASAVPIMRTPARHCATGGGDRLPRRRLRRVPATTAESKIDFGGRTGYVRAALNAGVPLMPTLSIGGQESQFYLGRGERLAMTIRLDKLLPAKIVTRILPPSGIIMEFGEDSTSTMSTPMSAT